MFAQGRAVVPEGHVSVASASREHEGCGVLALPAQRHQDGLWVDSGHGQSHVGHNIWFICLYFILMLKSITSFFVNIRFEVSLRPSGSRSWTASSPSVLTFCPTAERALCSPRLRGGSWRAKSYRPNSTARTCCSTWRLVRKHSYCNMLCVYT